MFEQYVPSVAVALVTVMLVALVVLGVILASIDRGSLVYGVVVAMGMTSLGTACLVGLFVLSLSYGPAGKPPHHQQNDAGPASNQMSTNDRGTTKAAPSRTDTNNAQPAWAPPQKDSNHDPV
jgi:hypothetical protein